jgi:hypothetical protein
MYLIPLNLDDPFKRVFDAPHIAQAFLEDMLGIEITSIEKLEKDYKITNAAALVRFDYRCKINNKYVIIEMQQGYKPDVVKRFYSYHCLSTALQLETIKETIRKDASGKEHRTRNYVELEEVITIIWMAQDNFGLVADFIEYNLYPKAFYDFVSDPTLSEMSKDALEERRAALFLYPKEDRRELSFLAKNRFLFAFQTNIVKNKSAQPYAKWFEFAEKTRNPNNKASDFEHFAHHSIFAQMIHRLSVSHADNQTLIQEMGEEAYYAAKKLGEQLQKEEDEAFLYWSIYDKLDEKYREYRDQYDAELKAERSKRFAILEEKDALQRLMEKQTSEATEKAVQAALIQKMLEKQKLEAIEKAAQAVAAKKLLEKEKAEAQKLLEKEKAEAQKLLEKEKAEAQKLLEKEKIEAQKLLEKEKAEAQKLLEKEKIAKKLLQEEQKKVKKLEKEQKMLAAKNQIQLIHTLFAAGLSVDAVAQLLQVPVQQILNWQKIKK